VRQLQTLSYAGRYCNAESHPGPEEIGPRRIPDFVRLAEAFGCVGLRCDNAADLDATINKAMSINDAPVVIDFVVERDAMVWPMSRPAQATTTSRSPVTWHRNSRRKCYESAHSQCSGGKHSRCAGAHIGTVHAPGFQYRVSCGGSHRDSRGLAYDHRR